MTTRTERPGPCWRRARAGAMALMLVASAAALAHEDERHSESAAPAPAPVSQAQPLAIADNFSRALASGDAGAVRALLLPNVLIFESGSTESSFAEYAGHHMPADMALLSALKRERLSQDSGGDKQTAWVATRSRLSGQYKGKNIDHYSTETLVMTWTDIGWRIAHVHWSSAPRKSKRP